MKATKVLHYMLALIINKERITMVTIKAGVLRNSIDHVTTVVKMDTNLEIDGH